MTLTLPLYGEKIVSDYLRTVDEIEALGARVVGKPPSSTTSPWVMVTQIGDRNVTGTERVEHLERFLFQFDCYAGADKANGVAREPSGQPEANLLRRTVRAALRAMRDAQLDDAVVPRVEIVGDSRVPDPDVDEGARERFVLTAYVWMRPR